jgi:prevent-host-death family protein
MARPDGVIGVRELRAHLSAYLRAVARGETLTIGDRRRRPIARLVPMERDPEREHFERLAREGRVTLPTGPKPDRIRAVKPRPGAKLVSDIVIEGRG